MTRKIIFNVGFTLLTVSGIIIVAFFRWTKLFGVVTSLIGEDVTTSDLKKEGVCQDPQTFYRVRQQIKSPTANSETFDQGHRVVSDLIAQTEQNSPRKSLVLRTARVQLSRVRGQPPLEEDVNFIRSAVQDNRYPSDVRIKARNVLYKIENKRQGR